MKRNLITFIAFSAFLTVGSVACYGQVTINQPASIAELMELKKEVARNESAYQVQVYNGNINDANRVLLELENSQKNQPVSLVFESPNYKVRLGSFRTRLEAEKNLLEIKKTYPAAFVVGLKQ